MEKIDNKLIKIINLLLMDNTTQQKKNNTNSLIFDKNNDLMVRYWLSNSFKKPKVTIKKNQINL